LESSRGIYCYQMHLTNSYFYVNVQRLFFRKEFRVDLDGPLNENGVHLLSGELQWPASITPDGLVYGTDYGWALQPSADISHKFQIIIHSFENHYPEWLRIRLEALSNPAQLLVTHHGDYSPVSPEDIEVISFDDLMKNG
jgi:hypothetical protein